MASRSPQDNTQMHEMDSVVLDALKMLPTCDRCRRLKRKCDIELPSCRLCSSAGVVCEFRDQVLQQTLPRSYIDSLLKRRAVLIEELAQSSSAISTHITESSEKNHAILFNYSSEHVPGLESFANYSTREACDPLSNWTPNERSRRFNFDGYFPVRGAKGREYHHFGGSSAVVLATEVLLHACPEFALLEPRASDGAEQQYSEPQSSLENELSHANIRPSNQFVHYLLNVYQSSINSLLPFHEAKAIEDDYELYMQLAAPEDTEDHTQAFARFRVLMMCAISCASKGRKDPWFIAYEHTFYAQALTYIDIVLSEVSARTLQALLLIIVYVLFRPQKGDVWRALGDACRLAVDLGNHCEKYNFSTYEESDDQVRFRRKMFWALYLMERRIGHLFGRSGDLLESIMTTNYIDNARADVQNGQELNDVDTTAYHCGLLYMRSEIFRDLYLCPTSSNFPMEWYQNHYSMIVQWHSEISSDALADLGTVTCHLAFHSTVILLFQSLLLQALETIDTETGLSNGIAAFPIHGYESSLKLLEIYGAIFRASPRSQMADFPVTFVAAHDIYIAGLTIMSCCLLSIRGQVSLVERLHHQEAPSQISEHIIKHETAYKASASCLELLSWCAIQWEGFSGMIDIFKEVSTSVLSKLGSA